MQITVIPLGTATPSLGDYVVDIQKFLQEQGATFSLTDMGTVVEGRVEELLGLATQMHELPFQRGVDRVLTQIVLDERRDKKIGLGDKIASVRNRLSA